MNRVGRSHSRGAGTGAVAHAPAERPLATERTS